MVASLQLGLILFSGILIAVADALIKKISSPGSFGAALGNPWMIAVCVLYFIQIVFTILVFLYHKEFGIYSNLFLVFYSISTLAIGYFIFREQLSFVQYSGIAIALLGVVLMSAE